MKIGMMSAWNQDAGPAVCAELIGRQWVKEGHEVRIFSHILSGFHGRAIMGEDEEFVCRCFSTGEKDYLDPGPILEHNFDVFITNDLGMFPMDELAKIFPLIKKTAKAVNIIHESGIPSNPSFYNFDWDRIVCFDTRYKNFLLKAYPPGLISIIPHPVRPWKPGDKIEARKKLNLPSDGHVLFIFGQELSEKLKILGSLRVLSKKYNILLVIVSLQPPGRFEENGLKIEFRKEILDLDRLHDYLHATDALIVNRGWRERKVAVSTTIFQSLGSGCPVLAYDSNFVENIPDEVIIKYSSYEEFEKKLVCLFEDRDKRDILKKVQEEYVRRHSPEKIAKAYLELFAEG